MSDFQRLDITTSPCARLETPIFNLNICPRLMVPKRIVNTTRPDKDKKNNMIAYLLMQPKSNPLWKERGTRNSWDDGWWLTSIKPRTSSTSSQLNPVWDSVLSFRTSVFLYMKSGSWNMGSSSGGTRCKYVWPLTAAHTSADSVYRTQPCSPCEETNWYSHAVFKID